MDRLSYGDCKALSNYMKSLLDAAGIGSRYTLVCAGRDKPSIISDFPSSQFNHAFLCVPQPKDTVWLECTSQEIPFNSLTPFTADRLVLVVDEHGGKLIRTPKLTAESNLVSRKTNVTLDANGGGFADVKTVMHGTEYDSYRSILSSDQTDRKKLVTKSIHIPNFELDNFSIQEFKAETPSAIEKLKLTVTDYCTKVGEKLMLCLNMMNKQSESPFPSADRKTPISFKWPVYEIDTVSYDLPQGYTLEKIPQKVSLQSDFGQYSTEVTKSGSTIRYIRTLKIFQADYPIEKYEDLVAFFEKIVTADENKVLLTRGM